MKTVCFVAAVMLLSGCGSSASNSVSGPFLPAVAQVQPTPVAGPLAGDWSGSLDDGDTVSVNIVQNGPELTGDGYYFDDDNPTPVILQGSVEGNSFEVSLFPEAPGASHDLILQGELALDGSTAECFLGLDGEAEDRAFTMTRDRALPQRLHDDSRIGLPEGFEVDFVPVPAVPNPPASNSRVQLGFTLELFEKASSVGQFYGHWHSTHGQALGPKYLREDPVTRGFVSGGGIYGRPEWCEFQLWGFPDRPVHEVGKIIFRRPQAPGGSGIGLDGDSYFFLPSQLVKGQRLQDRRFGSGIVIPTSSR